MRILSIGIVRVSDDSCNNALLGLDALPKADVSAPITFTLDLGTLGEHAEGD